MNESLIYKSFNIPLIKGQCLVYLGTPSTSPEAYKMVNASAHEYLEKLAGSHNS